MKTILALIIIVVALLTIPTVVCAPDDNPAAIASDRAIAKGVPDGPGFSEVGEFISTVSQEGFAGILRGVSGLAPGQNE